MTISRTRLAAQFVLITLAVYLLLTGLGLYLCYSELNNALDEQLDILTTEITNQIDVTRDTPHLIKAPDRLRTQPFRLLASIQLFDREKNLILKQGRPGHAELVEGRAEIKGKPFSLRSRSIRLYSREPGRDSLIGFLQVQLPTVSRDRSITKFGLSMATVTLLGLVLLIGIGTYLARLASRPIVASYELLKQFSADAAHELNTPLSTIKATIENMSEELDDPSRIGERIEVINRATERMHNLVSDLNLLTKLGIEAESPSQNPETIKLKSLLEDIALEFEPRFAQKQITFEQSLSYDAKVFGYRDQLHRMFGNLLENALKYTDRNGKVYLSLSKVGQHAVITVKDNGMGIPQEALEHLFDRFYRVDKARSREKGGSGLGLAIVKAIATMHGATVSVSSVLNVGSTFSIHLPISSPRVDRLSAQKTSKDGRIT